MTDDYEGAVRRERFGDAPPPTARDRFDRIIGAIDGTCPKSKPSTVTAVVPILGDSQTYVVQTYQTDRGFVAFVQMIDAEGRARLVLPASVTSALYRQRDGLIAAARRRRGRETWASLPEEKREAAIVRLREAPRGTRKPKRRARKTGTA